MLTAETAVNILRVVKPNITKFPRFKQVITRKKSRCYYAKPRIFYTNFYANLQKQSKNCAKRGITMGNCSQPSRAANIEALVNYFKSGIKGEDETSVGIELEHTLVHKNGEPLSYSEDHGQQWLLKQLRSQFESETSTHDGSLIGLERPGAAVTLEPAAQLELSAGPFPELHDALDALKQFEQSLSDALGNEDVDVLTPGYHPTRKAIDLELIPKTRYRIMNEYLGSISMFGICMMRGSASTQIAIDYTSVDDCLRKLRLANACVPALSLICDNSPIFEGAVRPHRLMRTEIWEKCDPARCTQVPGIMDANFTLEKYAEYILDAPIMVEHKDGREIMSSQLIGDVFADRTMSKADIEHVLSVFFTDVRLKTYIEVRPADAMPIDYVVAYAALVKGLLCNEASLEALDGIFAEVTNEHVNEAKKSLMADGYDGFAYGSPVAEIADELVRIATNGLPENEVELLAPLASLVKHRTTLADMALAEMI